MKGQIINVKLQSETDPVFFYHLDAKIVEEKETTFVIKYLNETDKLYEGCMVFRFDSELSEIDKECVDGFYETSEIEEAGYEKIDGVGYIMDETTDCWAPSSPSESEEDT